MGCASKYKSRYWVLTNKGTLSTFVLKKSLNTSKLNHKSHKCMFRCKFIKTRVQCCRQLLFSAENKCDWATGQLKELFTRQLKSINNTLIFWNDVKTIYRYYEKKKKRHISVICNTSNGIIFTNTLNTNG